MTTIIIVTILLTFGLGFLTGNRLTWWRMQRVWKRHPYAFKTIVEGVIDLRESRAKEKKGDDTHV